jgi:hypothetical protein
MAAAAGVEGCTHDESGILFTVMLPPPGCKTTEATLVFRRPLRGGGECMKVMKIQRAACCDGDLQCTEPSER